MTAEAARQPAPADHAARLVELGPHGWRLAARILGGSEGAEDVAAGVERLRESLSRAGYAAAPAAVVAAGLAHTAPPVPATLLAAIEKLVAGQATAAGSGTGSGAAAARHTYGGQASAAAKGGGMAMKIVAGVIAAAALAGGVAVVNHFGGVGAQHAAPLQTPPPTAGSLPPTGTPAPANPYAGMQEREEVFEFAQKPAVAKEGDKVIIAFASKGKCDATVSIVGPDGRILRHLASGVLGTNAPYPFQQNSLAQKVEWDGLTDDFKKAPSGPCPP